MTRAILIASALFLACDTPRVVASVGAVFEEPRRPSQLAIECARGQTRWMAPAIALTIHCEQVTGGRR